MQVKARAADDDGVDSSGLLCRSNAEVWPRGVVDENGPCRFPQPGCRYVDCCCAEPPFRSAAARKINFRYFLAAPALERARNRLRGSSTADPPHVDGQVIMDDSIGNVS